MQEICKQLVVVDKYAPAAGAVLRGVQSALLSEVCKAVHSTAWQPEQVSAFESTYYMVLGTQLNKQLIATVLSALCSVFWARLALIVIIVMDICYLQSVSKSNKDSKDSKSSKDKDDKKDSKDTGDGAHVDAVSISACAYTVLIASML